jgi:glucose/arabinose dehydrogenase
VVELAMNEGRVDLASRRQLLAVEQPFSNHNGGHLTFGPDGMLYVGLCDGGSAGDPRDNGQRLDTLLGKLLRLDPRPQGDQPYGIPPDNPFVRQRDTRPEIWAYGLRNPWRFSFDRQTGDLWIGDVGQDGWEEINFAPAGSRGGENYGWNRREGAHRFRGSPPPNAVDPAYEYLQDGDTCAVTGGFVYRGTRVPALSGVYVYGDFCDGRLLGLRKENGRIVDLGPLGPTVRGLSAFGEDAQGELYAMSLLDGGIYLLDS